MNYQDKMQGKNGYNLEDQWWEFAEKTCEKVSPIHIALYFRLVRLNNNLKWVESFGVPTDFTMNAIGIKSYRSYKKAFDDLIQWGFITLIEKSHNQYSCNRIALVLKAKANLDASVLKAKASLDASVLEIEPKAKALQGYINNEKMKTNKEKKSEFSPPNLEEVIKFFDENGYKPETGEHAYKYYSDGDWHDKNNNPVKNWKQKMRSVWFKDENRKKVRMLA